MIHDDEAQLFRDLGVELWKVEALTHEESTQNIVDPDLKAADFFVCIAFRSQKRKQ